MPFGAFSREVSKGQKSRGAARETVEVHKTSRFHEVCIQFKVLQLRKCSIADSRENLH